MKIAMRLDGKLVRQARKIASHRDTTLNGLVREYLEKLVAENPASSDKSREIEALERSFKLFSRWLDYGRRTWKLEDLYIRSQKSMADTKLGG